MLSAVAARKARLQAAKPHEPVLTPPPPPAPNTVQTEPPTKKPSAKRKRSAPAPPKSAQKKLRKDAAKSGRRKQRYFIEDVSTVMDDGDDGNSDVSMGELEEEGGILEGLEEARPPPPANDRRAWSPRSPPADSPSDSDARPPPVALPPSPSPPAVLSTFEPTPDENTFRLTPEERSSLGLSSDPALAIILSRSDTLSFVGTARLRVLSGAVSLFGTTLSPSTIAHRIFAPRSSPVPTLQPVEARGERSHQAAIPTRILQHAGDGDAVVVLQELRSGVEDLGRVVRTFDGVFRAPAEEPHLLPLDGFFLVKHPHRDLQPFQLPPSWSAALDSIDVTALEPHAYVVKGPKNAGKSTFARALLNRLIASYRRVAYLECDLGQSEFTPGGMVALTVVDQPIFGPPFTHPTLPYQAHYIGSTSPRSSPSHYLSAIHALLQTYRLDLQSCTALADVAPEDEGEDGDARIGECIPLVVNTMGWAKGLGADLTRKIEALVAPTCVFELVSPSVDRTWFPLHTPSSQTPTTTTTNPQNEEHETHILSAIPPSPPSARFTPADHRTLSLLSYFHALFPSPPPPPSAPLRQTTAQTWDARLPLCAVPPYAVEMGKAFDRVVLSGAGAEDVVPEEIMRVLNVGIVALVRTEDAVSVSSSSSSPSPSPSSSGKEEGRSAAVSYVQGSPPPDPFSSSCLGLALIRGVSPSPSPSLTTTTLHLLTPLPRALLGAGRTLVKGELELPVWGMLDWTGEEGTVAGVEAGRVPFLRWGRGKGGEKGGERRRVRRNLMRRGLM